MLNVTVVANVCRAWWLLLRSGHKEPLAFADVGGVLPDIARITGLAISAGAVNLLLGRNGRPEFSKAETTYLRELRAGCAALGIVCDGLMAVGPERFHMI